MDGRRRSRSEDGAPVGTSCVARELCTHEGIGIDTILFAAF
jgi:hypothetical protein